MHQRDRSVTAVLVIAAATLAACGEAGTAAIDAPSDAALDVPGDALGGADAPEAGGPEDTTGGMEAVLDAAGDGQEGAGADAPAGCPTDAVSGPGVAITNLGAVAGVKDGGTWAFKGIPYAAPPVGDLRFRPPAPAACYNGTFQAMEYGPACPQVDSKGAVIGSEDCLTLNVWAPVAGGAGTRLPVMVFLHGGGNIQGSSSEAVAPGKSFYDGRRLAERGVVVVTLNYRLGPLGFLALPGLSAESERGVSGNYGILDQLAALAWVRENAAAFGGDPGRVMVFGESAGAKDTCAILASPLAAGLFHAALMQSGGCTLPVLAAAEAAMSERVAGGSCGGAADAVACLRSLPAAQIVNELRGESGIGDPSIGKDPTKYGPVVDGWVLEESPLDAIRHGEHNPVPVVIGTNAEELAAMMSVKVSTEAEFRAVVKASFSVLGQSSVEQILAAYPVADYASPQDALVALYSDMRFNCPARAIARAAAGSGPVWRYFFTRRAETRQGPKPAQHGIELLYVFGTGDDIPLFEMAPADRALSEAIMGYWTHFAATGDPNGAWGRPVAWPAYDGAKDTFLRLDAPIAAGEGVRTAQCDLFDEIVGFAL